MSYEFDVFVSYAHRDGAEFARDLIRHLEAAGLKVWLDEEQMAPGVSVKGALVRALQQCRHGVFVVTRAWLDRDWTEWEADVFAEEGKGRSLIPIIRAEGVRKSDLGPYLSKVNWLPWQDSVDVDAQFWLLYCGLLDLKPGERGQWSLEGRKAQGLQPRAPILAASTEVLSTIAIQIDLPEALACDRSAPWGDVCKYAANTRSEAWFVVGPQRYGHDAFLSRVQNCLSRTPERSIVSIRWSPPWTPTGRSGFLEPLARAFDCKTEEGLVAAMRSRLLDTNLVLVHQPVAQDAFERDDLALYYTKWLPELMAGVDPNPQPDDRIGGVKALQALAWWPDAGEQRRAGTLESDARAFLRRLIDDQDKRRLPVRLLTELDAITRQHVQQWSEDYLPPSVDRGQFVDRVMDGARDPAEILDRIRQWFVEDRRDPP